jgi:hypothetical protein
MTDILQRYGIKEVADVTFYEIDEATGGPGKPVLVLDSLKVTSIEQTAETAEARGGKGNAKLIVWDFGKELSVTIEDALFSPKSLSIMFADGLVTDGSTDTSENGYILKSARVVATSAAAPEIVIDGETVDPDEVYPTMAATNTTTGIAFYMPDGKGMKQVTTFTAGQVYLAKWYHPVKSKSVITIRPDSFPGTYYVTGDTMIRSDRTARDEYFQFIIPKAKMQAEQTISMQADGDPSTFNMSLQILRPESGEMVKFIQYAFANNNDTRSDNDASSASSDGWVTTTTETDE